MWVLALVACRNEAEIPVGVTLEDGQVLVGDVTTPTLSLDGVFGTIEVPLDDVGMVVPVEAVTLGQSHGQVTVWLRNGSELRGRWVSPELRMALTMGGGAVDVDLPTDDVQALQLRGSAAWPNAELYRVRTTHGDDLLVDPTTTRIELSNELGTFAPFLSECTSVGPIGDPSGPWRVTLLTGTVLVGPLGQDALTLTLPAGPDTVSVPLTALASIDRRVWTDQVPESVPSGRYDPISGNGASSAPAAEAGLSETDGWFRNDRLRSAKR